MAESELKDDISVCFDTETVDWEPFTPGVGPPGVRARVLRRFDDGGVRSAVLDIPPEWDSGGFYVGRSDHQGFVISGDFYVGRNVLNPRAFFYNPAGSPFAPIGSRGGARLIMIYGKRPHYDRVTPGPIKVSQDAFILADAMAVEPITPEIKGTKLTGFERRVLFKDHRTGADTRLLKVPGGFEGRGPNWHPVHEEIYCLEGDIGPDDKRLLKPGWFLHNPKFGIHGYHEHSHGGATILEWHDGEWSVNFVEETPRVGQ